MRNVWTSRRIPEIQLLRICMLFFNKLWYQTVRNDHCMYFPRITQAWKLIRYVYKKFVVNNENALIPIMLFSRPSVAWISGQFFQSFALHFGHFLVRRILEFFGLVVMGRNLEQPFALNLDDVPHELFRREDQLEVDDPSREVLKHAAVWMDCHSLENKWWFLNIYSSENSYLKWWSFSIPKIHQI